MSCSKGDSWLKRFELVKFVFQKLLWFCGDICIHIFLKNFCDTDLNCAKVNEWSNNLTFWIEKCFNFYNFNLYIFVSGNLKAACKKTYKYLNPRWIFVRYLKPFPRFRQNMYVLLILFLAGPCNERSSFRVVKSC